MRYSNESKKKTNGIVYTPREMAQYLAERMIHFSKFDFFSHSTIYILDPAVGKGELLISLIQEIQKINQRIIIHAVGYDTDSLLAIETQNKLETLFPNVKVHIIAGDFLSAADAIEDRFDFIIANPPYIRTQILGSNRAQEIAQKMKLTGRVDIYYAFLLYMKNLLSDTGISGYITSNKFFTIKSGSSVRNFMINNYRLHAIVDFGDTKLFSASVLPCIVIFSKGKTDNGKEVQFTSIYEDKATYTKIQSCNSIFDHIFDNGLFKIPDGRVFKIQQGTLQSTQQGSLWVIASSETDEWLKKVDSNTWMRLGNIGKIRVGIKTTADNVFIGEDWSGDKSEIELLQPLITHRDGGQILPRNNSGWKVLYTHTVKNGKKSAVELDKYPKAKAYLESHYEQLSRRSYIQKSNRNWYEIWVPQNPASWENRKIVFRDISKQPEFWLDETGAIVNGDCYWIDIDETVCEETVYLALAIANSKFIEKYYDAKFNTKLYSGKRRYMAQYVEQFPIPFPNSPAAKQATELVKKIITECVDGDTTRYMEELNSIVDSIFEV